MVFYFIVQFVINTLQQLLLSLKLTLGFVLHVASQKNTTASWIHLHGRRVFHRGCKSNERGGTGSKRGIYSTFSLTIMFILLVFNTSSKLSFFLFTFVSVDNFVSLAAIIQLEILTIKRIG